MWGEWSSLTSKLYRGVVGWVPRIRGLFSWAGHFLTVEFPNPLPEFWHLAEVGNQGSH